MADEELAVLINALLLADLLDEIHPGRLLLGVLAGAAGLADLACLGELDLAAAARQAHQLAQELLDALVDLLGGGGLGLAAAILDLLLVDDLRSCRLLHRRRGRLDDNLGRSCDYLGRSLDDDLRGRRDNGGGLGHSGSGGLLDDDLGRHSGVKLLLKAET